MSPWAILGIVIAGIVGVGSIVAYHEIAIARAYDRGKVQGIAETTEHMRTAIAKQKAQVVADMERLKTLDRAALQKELERLCREAGGGEACAPRP